jgi:hypothetical protein
MIITLGEHSQPLSVSQTPDPDKEKAGPEGPAQLDSEVFQILQSQLLHDLFL